MDDVKKQRDLINKLADIVNELGWVIGLPVGADTVPGLIVGTEEFVKDVVGTYYGPNYDVFTEDPTGEQSLVEMNENDEVEEGDDYGIQKKKKATFH